MFDPGISSDVRPEDALPACNPAKQCGALGGPIDTEEPGLNTMPWSRTRKTFESLLAAKLQGRLQVHVTEYTKAPMDVGRGWITLDRKEWVSVQIPSFYDNAIHFDTEDWDFGHAVQAYVQMPFDAIKASNQPIVQGLAFLDRRMGRRQLEAVDAEALHEFGRIVYRLRCVVEGLESGLHRKPLLMAGNQECP